MAKVTPWKQAEQHRVEACAHEILGMLLDGKEHTAKEMSKKSGYSTTSIAQRLKRLHSLEYTKQVQQTKDTATRYSITPAGRQWYESWGKDPEDVPWAVRHEQHIQDTMKFGLTREQIAYIDSGAYTVGAAR